MIRRFAFACAALALVGPALAEDREKALKVVSERVTAAEKAVVENPADMGARKTLATAYIAAGRVLLDQNKVQESEATYRKAIAVCEQLVRTKPDDADQLNQLAGAYDGVGQV